MFHFKHALTQTVAAIALTTLGLSLATPASANTLSRIEANASVIHKVTLDHADTAPERTMDWRNPEILTTFELPQSYWIDGAELLVSARPNGRVNPRLPLYVKLNNSEPVRLQARGSAFDARIRLNEGYINTGKNQLKFFFKAPNGEECLSASDGQWTLDVSDTLLTVRARPKSRALQIHEINDYLRLTQTAPRSVRLVTRGVEAVKLQALAAQAIAVRMDTLPEFRTSGRNADMVVLAGTRQALKGQLSDPYILGQTGPKIVVHEGLPVTLVVTADTEQDVMKMMQAFSTHSLPEARRKHAGLGEVMLQDRLASSTSVLNRTTNLTDIGPAFFDKNWITTPRSLTFKTSDPTALDARVVLDVSKSNNIGADSFVSLNLNGKALGEQAVSRQKQSLSFDIPAGLIKGFDNVLTYSADLQPTNPSLCVAGQSRPALVLGGRSRIEVVNTAPSSQTDLSRFAATGAPFSNKQGKNTQVILTANSKTDFGASLKILGQLAKASGQGWADAEFIRVPNKAAMDKAALSVSTNKLVIGPRIAALSTILEGAPKSFASGLKGQAIDGETLIREASIERYASADADSAFRQFAANQSRATRVAAGGLAALYSLPAQNGPKIGVITHTPGQNFTRTANALLNADHWQNMSGSVARWNKSTILTAQLAPRSAISAPSINSDSLDSKVEWDLPNFDIAGVAKPIQNAWTQVSTKVADISGSVIDRFTAVPEAQQGVSPAVYTETTLPQIRMAAITPAVGATSKTTATARVSQAASARPIGERFRVSHSILPRLKPQTKAQTERITNTSSSAHRHKTGQTRWEKLSPKLKNPKRWGQITWTDLGMNSPVNNAKQKVEPLRRNLVELAGINPNRTSANPLVKGQQVFSPAGLLLILVVMGMMIALTIMSPNGRSK